LLLFFVGDAFYPLFEFPKLNLLTGLLLNLLSNIFFGDNEGDLALELTRRLPCSSRFESSTNFIFLSDSDKSSCLLF